MTIAPASKEKCYRVQCIFGACIWQDGRRVHAMMSVMSFPDLLQFTKVDQGTMPIAFGNFSPHNSEMIQKAEKLEARLKRVERELAVLKAAVAGAKAKPWYREIVGAFAGDDAFAEITRLGRLIRQGKIKR